LFTVQYVTNVILRAKYSDIAITLVIAICVITDISEFICENCDNNRTGTDTRTIDFFKVYSSSSLLPSTIFRRGKRTLKVSCLWFLANLIFNSSEIDLQNLGRGGRHRPSIILNYLNLCYPTYIFGTRYLACLLWSSDKTSTYQL